MIWTQTEDELTDFIKHANNIQPTIDFTSQHSTTEKPFLDVNVKVTNNLIHTDLYTKPTDKHLYLQPSSCHPRHVTQNIPYSLALRLHRIYSEDSDLDKRTNELTPTTQKPWLRLVQNKRGLGAISS